MNLKRLELSGFKSFARATKLAFPARITAIVGPNGSGKSNVVEALRWVLGEQSIKQLRGRRGEDLIFAGSPVLPRPEQGGSALSASVPNAPRMGRAAVALVFDNKDHSFPLEFEEVHIARHIRRDGVNDYFINNSAARLKDIAGLLGRIGLGASQHHIISQGAADRALWASPRERRAFIEEALGLRVFQARREEALKKFDETNANMERIALLAREIEPHAKYLKTQVDTMRRAEILRNELLGAWRNYCLREEAALAFFKERHAAEETPLIAQKEELEHECAELRAQMEHEEQYRQKALLAAQQESKEEQRLRTLEERRSALERELGRIEGQRYREPHRDALQVLEEIKKHINNLLSLASLRDIKQGLKELLGFVLEEASPVSAIEKSEERTSVQKGIASVKEEMAILRAMIQKQKEIHLASFDQARHSQEELRAKEHALFGVKEKLMACVIVKEQWANRFQEFENMRAEARRYREDEEETIIRNATILPWGHDQEWQQAKRTLERLRLKVEEIGAIDRGLIKEFEEVSERQKFLQQEYEDLAVTKASLMTLADELATRLAQDFTKGLERINIAFANLFGEMFRGGEARLIVGGEEALPPDERGIDIDVHLPRKRISNLEMLSGGERALTSIALLFALSQVSPPPFLVLDETDAALDETNSRRYGAMLGELSKHTQLIVVTHNRETMKRADVLYGVTMGQDGVSRLLSVKLDEVKQNEAEVA